MPGPRLVETALEFAVRADLFPHNERLRARANALRNALVERVRRSDLREKLALWMGMGFLAACLLIYVLCMGTIFQFWPPPFPPEP